MYNVGGRVYLNLGYGVPQVQPHQPVLVVPEPGEAVQQRDHVSGGVRVDQAGKTRNHPSNQLPEGDGGGFSEQLHQEAHNLCQAPPPPS